MLPRRPFIAIADISDTDPLSEVMLSIPRPDGSSRDTGHTATVFGATGALGRYIVNRLGTLARVYSAELHAYGYDTSSARMHRRGPIPR